MSNFVNYGGPLIWSSADRIAELERIEAAKTKRARKLAKYTDTPQAKVRRAAFEINHASAEPIPTPPSTDDFQLKVYAIS